jgi:tetratricopeptide (TPR) repeat protein
MTLEEAVPDVLLQRLIADYERAVQQGHNDEAATAADALFAHVSDWCDEHPSPDLELSLAAAEFAERGDWEAAEASYHQILALPDLDPAVAYRAHSDLARLYRLLQRQDQALRQARRAEAAARQTQLPVLVSVALHEEARCLLGCSRVAEAEEAIRAAIAGLDDDAVYNHLRARMQTLAAECAMLRGAAVEAEAELDAARRMLEPLADIEIAAGIQSDLARWWSVTAQLKSHGNDIDGTIAAWEQAVRRSKGVAALPHAQDVFSQAVVAQMLAGFARALRAADRADDAARAVSQRRELLARIGIPQQT